MTDQKKKKLELRRMKHDIEMRRAKRREALAAWLKIAAFVIISALLVASGYVICAAKNAEVERECEIMQMRHDLRVAIEDANKVSKNSSCYGLAQYAKLMATALLAMDVK